MPPTTPPDPLASHHAAVHAAAAAHLDARRALVIAALELTHGNRSRAAPLLRVTERTLHRWILDLDLSERLDALAVERGWVDASGPAARALRGRLLGRSATDA